MIEVFQEIVYDNLSLYCNYCKHHGHDEDSCHVVSKRNQNNKQIDDTIEVALKGTIDSEKYQGDAREILNEKRMTVDVDQSKATSLDRQLTQWLLDTSNIGVQTTTENKGNCNNQQAATYEGKPIVGVDAPRLGSGQKLMDSGQKLMDTSDVEDAENSGKLVLQIENKNATKNWTLVAHKNSTSNQTLSLTSQNNSPCSEKGATENFHDSEKRQDISNASRSTKLSPEAPVFVPKCVIAKKNESRALVLNTIDLCEDSLVENEEDNMLDLGEDSLDEDEEDNMLDICFDKVAREGDISPRQQRSGSNKSKKKTHGRQHS
ncbi:hypothetical protein H5410_020188 [Solanum commersonii]|uniref:NB-ARC domain containing protein n=1 Tax=Solanum commersonii TaxID=4109 RepID=A0A9J5Z7B2_SOLCO|nr:hypothetical protein H5410_020188 [Solanum commersonii]